MKILPLYCFLVIATSSKFVFVPTPAAINLLRKKYERPGIRCYLWGTYMRHIRSLNLPGGDIPAEFARIALAEVKTYPGWKLHPLVTTSAEISCHHLPHNLDSLFRKFLIPHCPRTEHAQGGGKTPKTTPGAVLRIQQIRSMFEF